MAEPEAAAAETAEPGAEEPAPGAEGAAEPGAAEGDRGDEGAGGGVAPARGAGRAGGDRSRERLAEG